MDLFKNIAEIPRRAWAFILFVLCLFHINSAMAYDSWSSGWNNITYDVGTGCIHYHVRYYQTWGSMGDGHCGFVPDDGWLDITQKTSKQRVIKIRGNQSSSLKSFNVSDNVYYNYKTYWDGSTDAYYVDFDIPVDQSDINKEIDVYFGGTWWRRGATSDNGVGHTYKVKITCNFAEYDLVTPVYDNDSYYGNNSSPLTPKIRIDWTRAVANRNVAKLGDVFLCEEGSDSKTSISGSVYHNADGATNGSFLLDVTGDKCHNLDQEKRFKIRQQYKTTKANVVYVTESKPFLVKAYPQISEKAFQAVFNPDNLCIDLSWNLNNAPNSNFDNSAFILTTYKNNMEEKIDTIPYVGGQSKYTMSYPLKKDDVATYIFNIRREATSQSQYSAWRCFDRSQSLEVSTGHCYPKDIKAVLAEDNESVNLRWTISGSVWTDGTKFSIVRTNLTNSTTYTYTLSKADFQAGYLKDELVQMCNKYSYEFKLEPGSNKYETQNLSVAGTYTPTQFGTVREFEASKGYYSDKVELSFGATSAFDEIAIERREYGNENSSFKKVQTVNASSSTDYVIEDKSCRPGIMFEYRVYGILNCAGERLSSPDTLYAIGFRTPTGDFYGRVTFENGQAVDSVEVRLESDDNLKAYALSFDKDGYAQIEGAKIQSGNAPITIQAWINPSISSTDTMMLVRKADGYQMGLAKDHLFVKIGNSILTSKSKIVKNQYTHVTAVIDNLSGLIRIYLNAELDISKTFSSLEIEPNTGDIYLGENFNGIIDEVRLWSRSLEHNEISQDYTRYLVGNENRLDAYYTFDFGSKEQFYDRSYIGTEYNGNTGNLHNVSTIFTGLTHNQLSYKGITNTDGSYSIRAVPYYGNGTAYNLTPSKGSHQFSPTQEVRFINAEAQSHTVNFVDNSSFEVSGTVVYSGGTYPVEGAMFYIDGAAVMKNSTIVVTDENGNFSFSVPVGIHEVKVAKMGHTFELDGRICNSDSSDRNYQDMVSDLKLIDNTKVKYVGRVAGGTVQEAYPVGHSLSTNNLANGITVKLTHTRKNYEMEDSVKVLEGHYVPNHALSTKPVKHYNEVEYMADGVLIHVNDTTGEFVAYVVPELYKVEVKAKNQGTITGSGSLVDFSSIAMMDSSISTYEYKDSIDGALKTFVDTVRYNKMQQFIKRNQPTLDIVQCKGSGTPMNYFGLDTIRTTNMFGEVTKVGAYDKSNGSYYFGSPVFDQANVYHLKASVYEEYKHADKDLVDRVPVTDATVQYTVNFAYGEREFEAEVDSNGVAFSSFRVNDPELTTATSTMSAKVSCGGDDNATTIPWNCPFAVNGENKVYVVGGHAKGTNFVTAGPDKVLTVLRDPPGSNSYSFLEKGVSFSESSTYTGAIREEGFVGSNIVAGNKVKLITGTVAPGALSATEVTSTFTQTTKVGFAHEAEYEGSNTKNTTTTLTTRFQTSDDPLYVGADGDVYIGYSTNIYFGETDQIVLISKDEYNRSEKSYEIVYTDTVGKNFMLAKTTAVNASQSMATTFAYPQVYIEQTLIPNMESLKESFLLVGDTSEFSKYKELAETTGKTYYVSYLSPDDPDFGKSNTDTTIKNKSNGNPKDILDGPSYKVFRKPSPITGILSPEQDTINTLNQWIQGWKDRIRDNEAAKAAYAEAFDADEKVGNYSFHAGSPIEYAEEYSTGRSHSSSFNVVVGVSLETATDVEVEAGMKSTSTFAFEENVVTSQGGTFESEVERSHSKGFALAEEGDDDYISVDVYREKDWKSENEEYDNPVSGGMVDEDNIKEKDYYSSFIFITRGGATSCPYEKAFTTKYYKPGTVVGAATLQLEVPSIALENDFVENVPSGEEAFLKLYLRNNSETSEDQWFDLRMIDASNPDGAVVTVDGNSMSGFALDYLVPAGETLVKTLSVSKGRVLNYDNLKLVLASKCQADPTSFLDVIADTVSFSVHFIPSCSDVDIVKPTNNWTYNTKCDVEEVNGLEKHYMPVVISGFDVNYDDFEHIELQYKNAAASDNEWVGLAYYYADDSLAQQAEKNGFNAMTIKPEDGGTITYKFFMDALPDQKYDLRAVAFCNINNVIYENASAVVSGIKDMYNPRLFGTPSPANGVLTIDDDVRINFNETIAEGMLSKNNFSVTGIRNGAVSSHDVAISLDGKKAYLATEAPRDLSNKNLTFESWINFDKPKNATFFSHGSGKETIEMGMDETGHVKVKVGSKTLTSKKVPAWELESWNHIALAYDNENHQLTAYVNYDEVIFDSNVPAYKGKGVLNIGRSISASNNYFEGKVDQFRIWNDYRSASTIQAASNTQLSGNEIGLISYYDIEEAKGGATEDKARGANLVFKDGAQWALPAGKSANFSGDGYVSLNSSAAVITSDMDFTLEFWFKAKMDAKNQTVLSSGRGLKDDKEDCSKVFSTGFDENGKFCFIHNNVKTIVNGSFADNKWHSFSLAVNRASGLARIYMDGALNTYFAADNLSSIAASRIVAGARVYNDMLVDSFDNYFTGSVDEVRLWKLYRQQNQLEKFNNEKLEGNEKGLLLYYPFEKYITWQGTQELQTSLDDKVNASVAKMVGDADFSDDIPPVKTKAAVSSLLFDYVVNNDAIIINLKENDYRIENTIVTFTADDIRDVNGNSILSPITWSAYISRNQLKWLDDAVTVNKMAGEPYLFEAQIVNNGGSIINYSLKNMPSWLSASTESGVISPLEKQTIEFEVDPSLAIGTYEEVIYLTNSNNVTEPLKLNISVEGETPKWNVDPSKYKYNMVVYGQLKIDNEFSNDEKDMLAAFQNGECVGLANMSYDKTMDMWYAMLTVYSNASTGNLEYRIWDASNGRVLSAVPAIKFKSDNIVGTPKSPTVFSNDTVNYQNIKLNKGWNWVTFNLANKNMADLNTYLGNGTWGSSSIVKDKSKSANYSQLNKIWVNPKSLAISNKSMFKVYSDVEQTLSVTGIDLDLSATEISVNAKSWTYLPYLPTRSMTIKAALAGIEAEEGDVIKSNEGFAMYYDNEWIGSLNSMQPNCGYMYKSMSSADKKLKYPTTATSLLSYTSTTAAKASANESNMSIIAYAPEKVEGDVVRAFVGDAENNVVELDLTDNYELQFINVSAKTGDVVRFTLEHNGVSYEATNQMSFVSDMVYGTPKAPVVLNFNISGRNESLKTFPNPVVDVLNISGEAEGTATLELVDAAGRVVYSSSVTTNDNVLEKSIDMAGFAAGSYVLKVVLNNEVKTFKIVKE